MARVFIVGSTDGLGRAAAETLIEHGHEVVVHARNTERRAAVRDLLDRGAKAAVGDLSDLEQTREVAGQVKRLLACGDDSRPAASYRGRPGGRTRSRAAGKGPFGSITDMTVACPEPRVQRSCAAPLGQESRPPFAAVEQEFRWRHAASLTGW